MMEVERKQRAEKSVVIVERLVRVQLRAMGCERFDIGIKRDGRRDDSCRKGRAFSISRQPSNGFVTKTPRALISTSGLQAVIL